ncbi:MAG: hypothetical protein GX770_05175 [Firmicutes bacterium]|nr:hypothetical protein [Bacillota bacterium]
MAVIILLFSGCRVSFEVGNCRIAGRVTALDGKEGISGVTIEYDINGRKAYKLTGYDGTWEFRANEGNRVKIWAHKDHYMFQPAPYEFTVTKDMTDLNFKLIGWSEDFSDDWSGWDVKYYDDGSYQNYVAVEGGGEYEIMVDNYYGTNPQFIRTISPLLVPHNYTVEVTTYPLKWADWDRPEWERGTCGLVFNVRSLVTPGEFYYFFRVRPDQGEVEYLKVLKQQSATVILEEYKKTNEQINSANTTISPGVNILKVIQNGNRVYLYVNGVEVWGNVPVEQQDGEFIRAGLFTSADPKSTYTARFDDFKLSSMGYAPQPQIMGLQSFEIKSHKGIETK